MRPAPPHGLYILGFGGHARSVGDVALAAGVAHLLFVDAKARADESFVGFAAVTALPGVPDARWKAFPAAGDNTLRMEQIANCSLPLAVLLAPSAHIGAGVVVAEGSLVAAGSHLGPLSRIGRGVIVNTGAIIEHESAVGDFSHVSVNAVVAGRSCIGRRVMVGAGAVVIDGVTVCDDVTIGAGTTVVADIVEPGVYVGTPARRIRGPG